MEEHISRLTIDFGQNINTLKELINEVRTRKDCYTGTGISHMFSGKKNAMNLL
jgi:hypothetical protein